MAHMAQVAMLTDQQPIRASCFSPSGEYFVLGTNSKALKICSLPSKIIRGSEANDAGDIDLDEEFVAGSSEEVEASDTGGNSVN